MKGKISFKGYEKQHRIPFVIYVHFENWRQSQGRSKYRTFLHTPCAFSYSLKCSYDETLSKDNYYVGEDCVEVFWRTLEEIAEEVSFKLQQKVSPQTLSKEERQSLDNVCTICDGTIQDNASLDFCPLSGKFLGAVHIQCQYVKKIFNEIPVVMYEFSKYGARYLLQPLPETEIKKFNFFEDLSGEPYKKKVTVYEKNYMFFSRKIGKISYKFIDFKRFIDEKLEDLEAMLGNEKKKRFQKTFGEGKRFALINKSFWFPFQYVDSFQKLKETTLPEPIDFHDFLLYEDIPDEEYSRVKSIWKSFRCQTLADLFTWFLKSRVFLLEDLFENLRELCLEKYKLDPAHYITIASLSWDAMLKKTKVELENLTDYSMISLIKSGLRGGITQCSKRCAIANNEYCPDFNRKIKTSYIINLDANNLAGWAMSQKLPFSNFRFLSRIEINALEKRFQNLKVDDEDGFILEVDLEYPQNLHHLHNDLPFCSEKILSPNAKKNLEKPILNFLDKEKYIIDYRYLLLCLQNGLVLKKIHRVLSFQQTYWLKPYIDYNTNLRKNAQNDFEVKLYKVLNNSVYGKTIQKTSKDKPTYAGFCILDLSKFFMYYFHYHVMLPKFVDHLYLLYMDTDSFFYEIETANNIYEELKNDEKILKHLDLNNERTLGKFKDEYSGKIIREFFGVGAKFYCLDVEGEEIKKAGGVPKEVKQKFLSKLDYQACVLEDQFIQREVFDSKVVGKNLITYEYLKTVLSPGDDKRFVLDDKALTLAWGHFSLN